MQRCVRWVGVLVVSTVMVVGSAGVAWGAAVAQNYPEVDISKMVVKEFPAGTPQTRRPRSTPATWRRSSSCRARRRPTRAASALGPWRSRRRTCRIRRRVLVRYPKDAVEVQRPRRGRAVQHQQWWQGPRRRVVDAGAVAAAAGRRVGRRHRAHVGGEALKQADATRYADINVPSNDVAWDVLAQVGAAVKQGGAQSPLPGLDAEHVYMAGYSQSGVDTAGFAIGLAKHYGTPAGKPVFDGYFPAAQAASATPLKAGTSVLPKFEYPVWPAVGVPVVNLEDQSGIMGFTAELPPAAQATLGRRSTSTCRRRRRGAPTPTRGRPVPALRSRGHAPRAGRQRWLRRPRLDVPDPRGGPGHVRYSSTVGSRPARSRRTARPREAGRLAEELQGVASTRTATRSACVRSPYLDERARPLRRAGARSDHLRARGPRGSARPRAALAKKYPSVDAYMKKFTKGLDAMIEVPTTSRRSTGRSSSPPSREGDPVLGQS